MGHDSELYQQYKNFQIGDSLDTIKLVLGNPIKKSDNFCLPQKKGFEHYFEETKNSNSTTYYLWKNGGNWFYCIGFNQKKVTYKADGHS